MADVDGRGSGGGGGDIGGENLGSPHLRDADDWNFTDILIRIICEMIIFRNNSKKKIISSIDN